MDEDDYCDVIAATEIKMIMEQDDYDVYDLCSPMMCHEVEYCYVD